MLHHHNRIRARGHRSASHYFQRLAWLQFRLATLAGTHFSAHTQRAWNIFGPHRKTIAKRSSERRIVAISSHIGGQNTAMRLVQRHRFLRWCRDKRSKSIDYDSPGLIELEHASNFTVPEIRYDQESPCEEL
jgi:hypothetical protein